VEIIMSRKTLQPVRGTHDLIGDDMRLFRHIVDVARDIAWQHGYDEMQTPIFEFSEVFHRSLGDTSDVVSKETYTFEDRGGESITLRPEFTAAIVRAFISNGYTQKLPFKAFYAGPAFRYERPQKGRLRQFHQVGVEYLGADAPWNDVESILCAADFLQKVFLGDTYKNHIKLEINTLGDDESRAAYREKLVAYLSKYKNDLSEESQIRLEKNPLRILDSKQEQDKTIVEDAPNFADSLNVTSRQWFDTVTTLLSSVGCYVNISPRLVRGLDYYSHTVFEFTSDLLGSQATVLAGGRYDKLVEQMGGGAISGVGWASGVERLMLVRDSNAPEHAKESLSVISINATDDAHCDAAIRLATNLRSYIDRAYRINITQQKNIAKAIKKALEKDTRYFINIGNDEISNRHCKIKDLLNNIEIDNASHTDDVVIKDILEKTHTTLQSN
jgi:histidyl-tRNA synthetase